MGKQRTAEISKGGKQFFPISHFHNAFQYINSLLEEYHKIDKSNKQELAQKLAELLDNINYLHPFREGNGRAQREFIRSLAHEKEIELNLTPPNNPLIYKKYMEGTINSDVELLSELFLELIN